jgi:hypothetical protein
MDSFFNHGGMVDVPLKSIQVFLANLAIHFFPLQEG